MDAETKHTKRIGDAMNATELHAAFAVAAQALVGTGAEIRLVLLEGHCATVSDFAELTGCKTSSFVMTLSAGYPVVATCADATVGGVRCAIQSSRKATPEDSSLPGLVGEAEHLPTSETLLRVPVCITCEDEPRAPGFTECTACIEARDRKRAKAERDRDDDANQGIAMKKRYAEEGLR